MTAYFDAVLNGRKIPVFNGTPDETEAWLRENLWSLAKGFVVCQGKTLEIKTAAEYLEERKYRSVLALVKKAFLDHDVAKHRGNSSGMTQLSEDTAKKILELF